MTTTAAGVEDLSVNDYLLVETPSMVMQRIWSLMFPAASLLYMAIFIWVGCMWTCLATGQGTLGVWKECSLFLALSAASWLSIACYRAIYLSLIHHVYLLNYASWLFDRQIWTFVWSLANFALLHWMGWLWPLVGGNLRTYVIVLMIWNTRNLVVGAISTQLSLGFMMNLNYELTTYLDRLSAITRLCIFLNRVSNNLDNSALKISTRARIWQFFRRTLLHGRNAEDQVCMLDNRLNSEMFDDLQQQRGSLSLGDYHSGSCEMNGGLRRPLIDMLNPIEAQRNSVFSAWGHRESTSRKLKRQSRGQANDEEAPLYELLLHPPVTDTEANTRVAETAALVESELDYYLTPMYIKKTKVSLIRNHMGLTWILDHPPKLSFNNRTFYFETLGECRELAVLLMRAIKSWERLVRLREASLQPSQASIEALNDALPWRKYLPAALADYDDQEQLGDNDAVARVNTEDKLMGPRFACGHQNTGAYTTGDFFSSFLSKQEASSLRSDLLPKQDPYGENIHGDALPRVIRAENIADAVTRLAKVYNDLCSAYHSQNRIEKALYRILTVYTTLMILFVYLIGTFKSTTSVVAIFGSLATGMSTLMGGGYQDLVQSMMFVLFWNPYRVGDRCRVEDNLVYPYKIKMLHTEFKDSYGRLVFLSNKKLAASKVVNESRASYVSVEFVLQVANTSDQDMTSKLQLFEAGLREYIVRHSEKFNNKRTFLYISRALPNEYLELTIYVGFSRTGRQWGSVRLDQSAILLKILGLTRKYKLDYKLPVQRFQLVSSSSTPPAPGRLPVPNILSTSPDAWMSDSLKMNNRAPVAGVYAGDHTFATDTNRYKFAYPGRL